MNVCVCVCVCACACACLVAQLCVTLCDPMDCNPSGSSLHGMLQARILEWLATSCSKGIFPTQGWNLGLLHCRQILYRMSHQGSPKCLYMGQIFTTVSIYKNLYHHWLNGHEFEWTPGVGDGQGGLVCCDSWGRQESETTERLNWTEQNWTKSHGRIPWRRDRLPIPVFLGFPTNSVGKESACNTEDLGLIAGLVKFPEEGKTTHSSILAWKIPWTEEPGGLQFVGSQRVRHAGATKHNTASRIQNGLLKYFSSVFQVIGRNLCFYLCVNLKIFPIFIQWAEPANQRIDNIFEKIETMNKYRKHWE